MKKIEQENDFAISLKDTFMRNHNDDSQDDTSLVDISSDGPTQFIKQQENDREIINRFNPKGCC